jgi:hypothetical protein
MSCQDLCIEWADYDWSTEFCRESTRRARKPYRCCECGDVIAVGDLHEYVAGKSGGEFWNYRTCAVCAEIRDAFKCDTWGYTVLWESVCEQMFPEWNEMTAIDCLARLKSQAAMDKLRARYATYQERAR